ncbi:hypothetical protein VP01_4385g1 [Puccinia sorghi]|uniref:Uncharacterized protein n=1 Tax=Puccinia sorghi TaxID=27349 RepID=A0A0L6UPQ5_9BASI|nr:hypothetical protein VP01_4385g1 [Puccinia sorghi]
MAKTMHQKLSDLEGLELPWDYDTMHIKCNMTSSASANQDLIPEDYKHTFGKCTKM